MSVLRRIADRFHHAGVPLMLLKGAALNLTVYDRPDARPMADLDLMVRPDDLPRSLDLLTKAGAAETTTHVCRNFFPRFHYETELSIGAIYPIKIDLHVRPFRPLRYAVTVPPMAFWERAEAIPLADTTALVPGPADMLLHLLVHSAVHGNTRPLWLEDIDLWIARRGRDIDWDRLVSQAVDWGLAFPSRRALEAAEARFGPLVPDDVRSALSRAAVQWKDRLALWQAPRDAHHPVAHVLVNALCTPDVRYAAAYLQAVVLPSADFLRDRDGHDRQGPFAHVRRWLGLLAGRNRPGGHEVRLRGSTGLEALAHV